MSLARKLLFARYSSIFCTMLLLVILAAANVGGSFLLLVLFTMVGFSGVFLAGNSRIEVLVSVVLAVPWLTLAWVGRGENPGSVMEFAELVLVILFMIYLLSLVVRHLMTTTRVTADLLFGAGASYLMLGVLWAFIYRLILDVNPDAISFAAGNRGFDTIVYFSFTTLTTLGYGDVLPVSPGARSMAILESIIGVLFTTLLVGRLVGIYLSGFTEKREEPE